MANSQLFSDRVRHVGVPDDQLIVIGSGLLDALGLRQAGDVDLVLTDKAFEKVIAENKGEWKYEVLPSSSPCLLKPGYELWTDWATDGSGHPNYDDLKDDSVVIDGIRYISPAYLRSKKIESARPKDITDIALLDEYIAQHKEKFNA